MENIYWWAPLKAVATSAPDPDSTFRFRVSLSLPHQSENVESWSIDIGRKWRRSRRVLGRLRWPLQSLSSASTVKKFTPFHLNSFFLFSFLIFIHTDFCFAFFFEQRMYGFAACLVAGFACMLLVPPTYPILFVNFFFSFFFFLVLARVKKTLYKLEIQKKNYYYITGNCFYYWELFLGMCFWCCHEKLNYHIGFCV